MTKSCNYDKKWPKNDKKLIFLKDKKSSLYQHDFKLVTLKLFDENLKTNIMNQGFHYWASEKKTPVAENLLYPLTSKKLRIILKPKASPR